MPIEPREALVSEIRRKLGPGLKIVILADTGGLTIFGSIGFHCFVASGFKQSNNQHGKRTHTHTRMRTTLNIEAMRFGHFGIGHDVLEVSTALLGTVF